MSQAAGVPARASLRYVPGDELRRSAAVSLHEALATVRPEFLGSRGDPVTVFVNGVLVGSVSVLHAIPVSEVVAVRRLSRVEAPIAHGSAVAGLALEVTLRRP